MTFDEAVNCIIEKQQEEHKFILIDPSDYQKAIITDTWLYQQRASVPSYTFFKVIPVNDEGVNLQRIKYMSSKELPEEIDSTWVKASMMFGGDVKRYTDRDTRGNPINTNSNYIVLNSRQYRDNDIFTAYLEPALVPELRGVFGDLYSEL